MEQISAVYSVLKELGIEEKDTLLLLNKMDCEGASERCSMILDRYPNAITMSAKSGLGLSEVAKSVGEALSRDFVELEVKLDPGDGKTVAWLVQAGEILSKQYDDESVLVHCRLPIRAAGRWSLWVVMSALSQEKSPSCPPAILPTAATFKPSKTILTTVLPFARVC